MFENTFQADVGGSGKVGASEAAAFLKKSNLSEAVLHEVLCIKDEKDMSIFSPSNLIFAQDFLSG